MSQETLNTVLAGVAALTGVVGILLTVRFNRQRTREREEDRLLAQEQLELAREQSARLPELVVTGVRLVGVDEVGEVHDLVREVREDRAQEEAARKAKEAKRRELEGVSPLQRDVEMWSFEDRQRSARYVDPLRYEGPLPNRVVLVDIANRGRTTAFEISGALYFEAEYLEPLGYFSGVEGDVHLQEGAYGMEVGEARDIMLTPGSSRSLIVAVKVRRTGTARVSYDLSSPTGSSTGDTLEIELH